MKNPRTDLNRWQHGRQWNLTAVLLTGAAVALAVVVGLTGPRLHDRHGSAQQELPIGELGYTAEYREAQQAYDAARPDHDVASADAVDRMAQEVFGEAIVPPDISAHGFTLRDARVVELAPGNNALALFHRGASGNGAVSLYGLRDRGAFVRFDGFGSALPLAPGDEWAAPGTAERDGPPRVIYAVTDGSILWLMLAADVQTIVQLAPALAPRVYADRQPASTASDEHPARDSEPVRTPAPAPGGE